MVLEPGNDDLVVLLHIAATPTLRDQVDAFGRTANKDDLPDRGGIQEAADLLAGGLVGIGGARG